MIADELGITDGIDFVVGEYVTIYQLTKIVNNALDVPLVARTSFPDPTNSSSWIYYVVMDGADGNLLRTLRSQIWDNCPIYFDGTNWIMLED